MREYVDPALVKNVSAKKCYPFVLHVSVEESRTTVLVRASKIAGYKPPTPLRNRCSFEALPLLL